jgi:hypothetical protein
MQKKNGFFPSCTANPLAIHCQAVAAQWTAWVTVRASRRAHPRWSCRNSRSTGVSTGAVRTRLQAHGARDHADCTAGEDPSVNLRTLIVRRGLVVSQRSQHAIQLLHLVFRQTTSGRRKAQTRSCLHLC